MSVHKLQVEADVQDEVRVDVKFEGTLGIAVAAGSPPKPVAMIDGKVSPVEVKELRALGTKGGLYLVEIKIKGRGEGDVYAVNVTLA